MDFATQMRIMRTVRRLKQADVSAITGLSLTELSFLETGKQLPSPDAERKIKIALRWPTCADKAFAILEGQESAA